MSHGTFTLFSWQRCILLILCKAVSVRVTRVSWSLRADDENYCSRGKQHSHQYLQERIAPGSPVPAPAWTVPRTSSSCMFPCTVGRLNWMFHLYIKIKNSNKIWPTWRTGPLGIWFIMHIRLITKTLGMAFLPLLSTCKVGSLLLHRKCSPGFCFEGEKERVEGEEPLEKLLLEFTKRWCSVWNQWESESISSSLLFSSLSSSNFSHWPCRLALLWLVYMNASRAGM